jgi:hypothetical protein
VRRVISAPPSDNSSEVVPSLPKNEVSELDDKVNIEAESIRSQPASRSGICEDAALDEHERSMNSVEHNNDDASRIRELKHPKSAMLAQANRETDNRLEFTDLFDL